MLDFDFYNDELISVPQEFLSYRGDAPYVGNSIIGLAFGPDGLYFAPLWPDPDGVGSIFRVSFDPPNEHTYTLSDLDPYLLMDKKGCFGCHSLAGEGGTLGPSLDRDPLVERLRGRLDSQEYQDLVADLDLNNSEPFASYTNARQEVLDSTGIERVRIWLKYHLMEPRFDNPGAEMPNLGIPEHEAIIIANSLLKEKKIVLANPIMLAADGLRTRINTLLLPLRIRHLIIAFFLGITVAFIINLFITKRTKYLKSKSSLHNRQQ